MKKLSRLILLLCACCLHGLSQTHLPGTLQIAPLLKQALAGDPDLILSARRTSAEEYINIAILDNRNRMLTWFNCYGSAFDSVRLLPAQSFQLASHRIDPFDFYKTVGRQNIIYLRDAVSQFRLYGRVALNDTLYTRRKVNKARQVLAAQSTLQKLVAIEGLLRGQYLKQYLFDSPAPGKVTGTDSFGQRQQLAGQMIKGADTTFFYSNFPYGLVAKMALFRTDSQRLYVYDIGNHVIDSMPLRSGRYETLLKSKEDVFLLYRGWLELQNQEVMVAQRRVSAMLAPQDSSVYLQTTWLDNREELLEARSRLALEQQRIEHKIEVQLLPDLEGVTQLLNYTYADAPTTVSYLPGIGLAYTSGQTRGEKIYEVSDHRGNVFATFGDRKLAVDNGNGMVEHYNVDIANASDYYPFGSLIPGRTYRADDTYRYGFNGKENDNDVKGEGNQQDYGMRVYDPRLGRFLSVDPLAKSYPWNSTYAFAENDVVRSIDLDGEEKVMVVYEPMLNGVLKITISRVIDVQRQVQNMELKFNDGTKNDQSKEVIRLGNNTGAHANGKLIGVQENGGMLSNEIFIARTNGHFVDQNTGKYKNTPTFHMYVEQDDEDTHKTREVGVGRDFDKNQFKQVESVGFETGMDFKQASFYYKDSYFEVIKREMAALKFTEDVDDIKQYHMLITEDEPLDDLMRKHHENEIKGKFGSNIVIEWRTSKKGSTIHDRSKGKLNTNITITATGTKKQ